MKTTHTYAILEISAGAYAEIRALLDAAGYQHALHDDVVDMHGIAIRAAAEPYVKPAPTSLPGPGESR